MALTPDQIRDQDLARRQPDFEADADRLLSLYTGRGAKDVVLNYLKSLGLGHRKNRDPAMYGTVPRLVSSLNVLYSSPPTRLLRRGDDVLEPSSAECKALEVVYRRSSLNAHYRAISGRMLLHGSCLVSYGTSPEHGTIKPRVFAPQYAFRQTTLGAEYVLESDEAIALLLSDGDKDQRRYEYWVQTDEGWTCRITNGGGEPIGYQPYGESGLIPYSELPLQLLTDEPLIDGSAWPPLPIHRLTNSLAVDGVLNDLPLLVALQAHSQKVVTTNDTNQAEGAVREQGADKVWILSDGTTVSVLNHQPAIQESDDVIERILSGVAQREGLPPDQFSRKRTAQTGEAQRVAQLEANLRRLERAEIAEFHERVAYKKIAAITEVDAKILGLPVLDKELELIVAFGHRWEAASPKELQDVAFRDMAIGARSLPEYVAEARQIGHAEAEALLEKIDAERKRWPLGSTTELVGEYFGSTPAGGMQPRQNPAALIEGPRVPAGPGSAVKTPGAFNPQLGTASEGASVTDMIRR